MWCLNRGPGSVGFTDQNRRKKLMRVDRKQRLFLLCLFVCCSPAFTARWSSHTNTHKHTQTHTQSSGVSALRRCCSCNCRLATGWCPLLLCLLEMFVVNKEWRRTGGGTGGRGGMEMMREGSEKGRREEMSRVREWRGERAVKWPAAKIYHYPKQTTPPPPGHAPTDSKDSFSHNSSDPRPRLSSICQPVCDNYRFEMPARHRASSAPC